MIEFWTQGVPVHMDFDQVQHANYHIYRIETGIGASIVGSSWKPFCCLHLRHDTKPSQIILEVIPPQFWVP